MGFVFAIGYLKLQFPHDERIDPACRGQERAVIYGIGEGREYVLVKDYGPLTNEYTKQWALAVIRQQEFYPPSANAA